MTAAAHAQPLGDRRRPAPRRPRSRHDRQLRNNAGQGSAQAPHRAPCSASFASSSISARRRAGSQRDLADRLDIPEAGRAPNGDCAARRRAPRAARRGDGDPVLALAIRSASGPSSARRPARAHPVPLARDQGRARRSPAGCSAARTGRSWACGCSRPKPAPGSTSRRRRRCAPPWMPAWRAWRRATAICSPAARPGAVARLGVPARLPAACRGRGHGRRPVPRPAPLGHGLWRRAQRRNADDHRAQRPHRARPEAHHPRHLHARQQPLDRRRRRHPVARAQQSQQARDLQVATSSRWRSSPAAAMPPHSRRRRRVPRPLRPGVPRSPYSPAARGSRRRRRRSRSGPSSTCPPV
jgi:hypothetical protein